MGRVNRRKKHIKIKQAHKRHEKILKLKTRYQTGDSKAREVVVEKLKKLSATYALAGTAKAK
jgi:late competence protein required for DNA uptake (superfamily II DNA/RNA helicase)